ncbi:MAG: hypothetical protein CMC82_03530 [Flavobacteriaceae bacterium]|mgnify:FL=1|nr:hypothetical protein [Flavobacteriaceae bacterium]
MTEFKFPTEEVELPSKGLVYSEENPLSSGKIEIKYMTAKEEDILTNQAYIQKGTVLDKLIESLIVNKDVNYKDLIIGDKNAVLIASRILGYGKEYSFKLNDNEHQVDLSEVDNKEFDSSSIVKGVNEFSFELPYSTTQVTYKILNGHDEVKIDQELRGLKKINKDAVPELTTRLKHMITSVNGDTDRKNIREFVDNYLLARDSRALRKHIEETQPDVDLTFNLDGEEEVTIPIGINFFWPDV